MSWLHCPVSRFKLYWTHLLIPSFTFLIMIRTCKIIFAMKCTIKILFFPIINTTLLIWRRICSKWLTVSLAMNCSNYCFSGDPEYPGVSIEFSYRGLRTMNSSWMLQKIPFDFLTISYFILLLCSNLSAVDYLAHIVIRNKKQTTRNDFHPRYLQILCPIFPALIQILCL